MMSRRGSRPSSRSHCARRPRISPRSTSSTRAGMAGGAAAQRRGAKRSGAQPAGTGTASVSMTWRCGRPACSSSTTSRRSAGAGPATWMALRSRWAGNPSWNQARPNGRSTTRSAARAKMETSCSAGSGVGVPAGPADDDLVLFDRDLDRPVAGPVLRVHRVVLDRGIEPQAVALVAMVERGLEGRAGLAAAGAPRAAARLGLLVRGAVLGGRGLGRLARLLFLRGLARGLLGGPGLLLGAALRLGVELRADRLVVLRPEIDLLDAVAVLVGLELLLALEGLDLLDGHLELMRDPRIGAALAYPGADLVEVRA